MKHLDRHERFFTSIYFTSRDSTPKHYILDSARACLANGWATLALPNLGELGLAKSDGVSPHEWLGELALPWQWRGELTTSLTKPYPLVVAGEGEKGEGKKKHREQKK